MASNLSLKSGSVHKISVDLVVDIIDELRRDRKIIMAIKNASYVKEYIKIDL